jgi:hypothetical protein
MPNPFVKTTDPKKYTFEDHVYHSMTIATLSASALKVAANIDADKSFLATFAISLAYMHYAGH